MGAMAALTISVPALTSPVAAEAATVTDLSSACPTTLIAEDGFADVPQSSTHERAVDCLTWWQVTTGSDWGGFLPADGSTRAASASFVARTLAAAGAAMPSSPPDAFSDDNGSVHELAINQLAALGIVRGTSEGRFSPNDLVTRGQMATMVTEAIRVRTGEPLPPGSDAFDDDNGSVHEPAINALASAGLAAGTAPRTFNPNATVRRDQTASFLARTLDHLVAEGLASPPANPPPPRNTRYAYVVESASCAETIATRRIDGTGTIIAATSECDGQHLQGPRLSPDGRLVAYLKLSASPDTRPNLLLVAAADGSFNKVIGDETTMTDLVGLDGWTPDGAALVLSYNRSADHPGFVDLPYDQRLQPIDGSAPVAYREVPAFEERSPFGDRVTARVHEDLGQQCSRAHYTVADLPSGTPTEIFHHDYPSGCGPDSTDSVPQSPHWTGDGAHVVVSLGESQTDPAGHLVDPATGQSTTITLSGATDLQHLDAATVTSDSTRIIWHCRPNEPGLARTTCISNLDGTDFRQLAGADDLGQQMISLPGH
jgi:hypothetical protein